MLLEIKLLGFHAPSWQIVHSLNFLILYKYVVSSCKIVTCMNITGSAERCCCVGKCVVNMPDGLYSEPRNVYCEKNQTT